MKKKLLLTLMVVSNILMFVACGSDDDKAENTTAAKSEATTEATTADEAKAYKLQWTAPEGFTSEDGEIYISDKYPTDTSNVTYVESANDPMGIDFTKEEYESLLENAFNGAVDVNISKFDSIESNGCEGLLVVMNYEYQGIKLEQTQYMYMSGEDLYGVTYSLIDDSEFKEAFEESAKTIEMVVAE